MKQLPYLSGSAIQLFIESAIKEDIGEGDHSTVGSIPPQKQAIARLLIKDTGVLAGVELAEKIFKTHDNQLQLTIFKTDGDLMKKGDIAFEVKGAARSILSTERVVLNCMQRMSGIATYTHRLKEIIKATGATLIDTRKTTPNFRIAEKWAVAIGGGTNHRYALYDMVMLKDNHIDMAGGITNAVANVTEYLKNIEKPLKIEVETRNITEVKEALRCHNVDVIMLDNMSLPEMAEAVKLIDKKCKTEASGGITESNLLEVAKTGVDYISVGALTHSVKSLDLSLKVVH
jgi:nicotinate-nucleotide pyrophosphorylase (carboxylating)